MPWTHQLCEGNPLCPGKVVLALEGEHSELVIYSKEYGRSYVFYCSLPALLGAQRGTRAHLVSQDGECVLSKEADGVWINVLTTDDHTLRFFVPSDEYLMALARLVD